MTLHPLPFPYRGALQEQDGTVVQEDVPFAWWPAQARAGRAGVSYDHTGEAPLELAAALGGRNRRLVLENGQSFQIVAVQEQQFLPHTTLQLRRVEPRG